MANVYKTLFFPHVTPRKHICETIMAWLVKNHIVDTFLYCKFGNKNQWEYRQGVRFEIATKDGTPTFIWRRSHDFATCITGGETAYQAELNTLLAKDVYDEGTLIGMACEGYLNQALHYDMHPQFKARFKKFLKKYGYHIYCIENCHYILYQRPEIVTVSEERLEGFKKNGWIIGKI